MRATTLTQNIFCLFTAATTIAAAQSHSIHYTPHSSLHRRCFYAVHRRVRTKEKNDLHFSRSMPLHPRARGRQTRSATIPFYFQFTDILRWNLLPPVLPRRQCCFLLFRRRRRTTRARKTYRRSCRRSFAKVPLAGGGIHHVVRRPLHSTAPIAAVDAPKSPRNDDRREEVIAEIKVHAAQWPCDDSHVAVVGSRQSWRTSTASGRSFSRASVSRLK